MRQMRCGWSRAKSLPPCCRYPEGRGLIPLDWRLSGEKRGEASRVSESHQLSWFPRAQARGPVRSSLPISRAGLDLGTRSESLYFRDSRDLRCSPTLVTASPWPPCLASVSGPQFAQLLSGHVGWVNSCPACCGPGLGSENIRVVKDASPSVVWEVEAVLGRLHCCAGFGALGHWAGPGQPGWDTLILPGTQTNKAGSEAGE